VDDAVRTLDPTVVDAAVVMRGTLTH